MMRFLRTFVPTLPQTGTKYWCSSPNTNAPDPRRSQITGNKVGAADGLHDLNQGILFLMRSLSRKLDNCAPGTPEALLEVSFLAASLEVVGGGLRNGACG